MEDKPRYSRITDLIELIVFMSSKLEGVSLNDIQEHFNVSRRTAERMRDSVLFALPQVEEIPSVGRVKRWGFPTYSLSELVYFSSDEIAFLEKLKTNCDDVSGCELQEIITKLKALNRRKLPELKEHVELLMKSEGYAISQSQSYKVDFKLVSDIRLAIKENRKISAIYKDKKRLLIPLGLIYGEKIFLVAKESATPADKGVNKGVNKGVQKEKEDERIRQYVLHKLKDVKVTYDNFEPEIFDLKEYSKNSFGVFQGKVYNVKLKFIPEAADDVINYNFHPTQKIKQQPDGSVIVTFKASGDKHIIWNLFKWGYAVEILAPQELKNIYKDYIDEIKSKL